MNADSINICDLSTGERIALMERLWRSLTLELDRQGPPAWHEEELHSRHREWEERESVSEDWIQVRDALRSELK